MAKRWTDEESAAVLNFIWGRSASLEGVHRSNVAIEKRFRDEIALVRGGFGQAGLRHKVSLPALQAASGRRLSADDGLRDDVERVVRRAFFIGGFNTDRFAALCRSELHDEAG